MEKFKGYKTYIVMVIGIIFNGAVALGFVSPSLLEPINYFLGFLGLGAIRNAIPK